MADLIHRLRRVAQMAGDDRRKQLEHFVRNDARAGRALLEQSNPRATAEALMRMCHTLGFESEGHARRLLHWCGTLGAAIGLDARALDDLALGALVHDIGKLGITAEVLGSADALTSTELDWIRMHSSLGHALLAGVPGLGAARTLVLSHHEYWNGSGYPEGRSGAEIPLPARVFCLVDSYEAIIREDVVYRPSRAHAAAREELLELAGVRYDAELVEAWSRLDSEAWASVAA